MFYLLLSCWLAQFSMSSYISVLIPCFIEMMVSVCIFNILWWSLSSHLSFAPWQSSTHEYPSSAIALFFRSFSAFFFLILTWYTSNASSFWMIAHLWTRGVLSTLEVWKKVWDRRAHVVLQARKKLLRSPQQPVMSAFFLSSETGNCKLPTIQNSSLLARLTDRLLPAVGGLSVGVVFLPAPWLHPGPLVPGNFLPPAYAIHSSVPHKAMLFCFMPWSLLWMTGLSLKSLVIGVSSWLLITTSHPLFDLWNLVTFFYVFMVWDSSFAEDVAYAICQPFLFWGDFWRR